MVPDRLRSALFSKQSMFSAVLVAAAFALLFLAFDVSRALSIVAGADPGLYLLALVLFYVPFVFRGERWRLLLREAGVETPLVEATEVTFLSFFVNNVVPAQLGDLYRGHLLGRRREESRSLVTGTVFVDRVLDFAFLVVSTTLISYAVLSTRFADAWTYLRIGYGFLGLVLLGSLALLYEGRVRLLPDAVRDTLQRFREGAASCLSRGNALPVLGYTLLVWLFVVLRVYVVALALGVDIGVALAGFIGLFMIMLTIIPLTPAGLGAVELLTTGFLTLLGMEPAAVLSIVLLDRTITYLSLVVSGGGYYLWTDRRVV